MSQATTASRTELLRGALAHLERKIGADVEQGGIDKGERAELRRLVLGEGLPPAFWRLVTELKVTGAIAAYAPSEGKRAKAERALAAVMKAMALMAGLHGERAELGTALASTGYSEDRFARLCRSTGPALAQELETAARWCAGKGVALRWDGIARLTLAAFLDDEQARERESHRQARAYFARAGRDQMTEAQD